MYNQIKLVKRLIAGIVLAGFTTVAFSKVGVVDVNKVLEKSPQAIAANKRLESEFAPRKKSIIQMRENLRKMEDRLSKDGVTMSRDKLRDLELKIRKNKRKVKRVQEDLREDVTIRRNEELRKLHAKVKKAVSAVASKEKYEVVLVSNGVFFYADSVDITKKVIGSMK